MTPQTLAIGSRPTRRQAPPSTPRDRREGAAHDLAAAGQDISASADAMGIRRRRRRLPHAPKRRPRRLSRLPVRRFRTGDAVAIGYEGRTVRGVVKLASPNGRSLMLEFDAMLGGFVGMMPVLLDDAGVYRDLVERQPVDIQPAPPVVVHVDTAEEAFDVLRSLHPKGPPKG